jgi:hypothetical protein
MYPDLVALMFPFIILIVLQVGMVAGLLYLMFGKVLIPVARSLCNFLDAKAWSMDHQYKPRPGHEPESDLRYRPNV